MLKYFPVGPMQDGRYLVGYMTPGIDVVTIAEEGHTEMSASDAASRLNDSQQKKEKAIEYDRLARGLGGTYHHGE